MNILANETNKATIVDVAKMADVSIKTVSRVANGQPHVRDETRARVQRAIDLLGYSANPYAQHMGAQSRPPARAKGSRLTRVRQDTDTIADEERNKTATAGISIAHIRRDSKASGDRDIDWW